MFRGENTTFNGVKVGPGIVDANGVFRRMTEEDLKLQEILDAMKKEAMEAQSPVSLRVHPIENRKLVYLSSTSCCYLDADQEYKQPTVVHVDEKELLRNPFTLTCIWRPGNMELENEMYELKTHFSGEFRLRTDTQEVYKIVYNYGYMLQDAHTILVDGQTFALN